MNEENGFIYIFTEDPQKIVFDKLIALLGSGELDEILKNVDDTQKSGFLFATSYMSAMLIGKCIQMKESDFNRCVSHCSQLQAANQAINALKSRIRDLGGDI